MSEQRKAADQSLSEISHLFLTGLRQRQTGGAPLPQRKPPAASTASAASANDPVNESLPEFNSTTDSTTDSTADAAAEKPETGHPCLSAVLAHHLGASAAGRVRDYARHMAGTGGRVGLIELGDDGVRLSSFDRATAAAAEPAPSAPIEPVDARRIAETIGEMSWDIDRWILFLPGGAAPRRARELLGKVQHWTILAAASDTGVVAAYRALKSVAPLGNAAVSLAILDAEDDAHGAIVHRKLAGASKQFLDRPIDFQGRVAPASGVSECVVLWCRAAACGAPVGEHWTAITELAARSVAPEGLGEPAVDEQKDQPRPIPLRPFQMPPAPHVYTAPQIQSAPRSPIGYAGDRQETDEMEILDLPADMDGQSVDAILAAILQQRTQWVACPIKSPMCATSTVAVDRDGRLTLLAAAPAGLAELPVISRAFGWLVENRLLVRMALPQMNIDAAAMPVLQLFIEQRDAAGDQLAATFKSSNVHVQTYRRLKWGQKTGLLLEAA